jgi:hypothetical protein
MIASQINVILSAINGVQQARFRAMDPMSHAEYVRQMDHYTAELNRLYTQRARELPELHRILGMRGLGPPRKMTDAEKKAAQALRDKLAKKPRGKESEEELADRARVESELKRKNDLQQTEEGRDELAAEASAKEDRRQQLAETTDEGLRDITGENRRAKQEMERQANDPLVKAANAIKNLGKKGAEELLKVVGVDGSRAEKIVNGVDDLLSKGKVSDESLDAAKGVAIDKLKEKGKEAWDEGVKNKQKEMKETEAAKKAAADARQVAEETAAVASASGSGKPKRTRDEWEDGVDPKAAYYGDYRHPGDEWHRGRNRKARYSSMEGGGLTDYFSKGISGYLPNFANVTNQFVSEGYPRDSLMWLRKNGSEQVRTIRVRRAPVNKNIERALHFISLGQWEEGKKAAGYDSMFHLALIVNGRYTIEKLAKIRLATAVERLPNEEFMDVPITDRLFIGDMLERTETVMGKERYFRYDAFENNCQNFVASILRANSLMTPELNLFVVQPVDELLKKQPGYLQAVSRTLTNLGGIGGAKPC